MTFKDYYQILGIQVSASQEEIKKAYRRESRKWHPDVNPGVDVTEKMQDINEAYAILKDEEKRKRYDAEYRRFIVSTPTVNPSDFEVQDENLKSDMESAREYAQQLVKDFVDSFADSTKTAAASGCKSTFINIFIYLIGFLVADAFFALLLLIDK